MNFARIHSDVELRGVWLNGTTVSDRNPSHVEAATNVRAHRPPSPDLSKLQNSKAPVPRANGGSLQRLVRRRVVHTQKNLRPIPPEIRSDGRRCSLNSARRPRR